MTNRVLHNNIVYIADAFHAFCSEHSIDYYLLGGSALGAVRHGGFIPWDDDFDVCIGLAHYSKLINLRHGLAQYGLTLVEENTPEWPLFFSKIRLDDSLYLERVEDEFNGKHNGVYIDVMCLSPGYSSYHLRYLQYSAAKVLNAIGISSRGGYKTTSFLRRIALFLFGSKVMQFIKPYFLYFVRYPKIFNTSIYLNHFFGRAEFSKACIKKSWVGDGKKIWFEGRQYMCFEKVEKYLESRFGVDYLQMPSEAVKSQYPSHCIKFISRADLNKELSRGNT